MDKTSIPSSPRKNALPKEVFRELTLSGIREKKDRRLPGGRDSPESGSLYSDYESGQQYEQDLPSGYNSGEQYDTLSTGYMSGEAYELPETRQELLEPTLASIEEVSTRSAEDLFTIQMPENQLLVQVERMESSSSSSLQNTLETVGMPDPILHKGKRKKTVSYCTSVPIEKSPLGLDVRSYRELLPSDTDTTSCFDSDGACIRSEAQSSDSGAVLLHSSRKKRRDGAEPKTNRGSRSKLGKANKMIRSHEEFFLMYDNKYWGIARTLCFWFSILAILGSIASATIMIALLPHACDPILPWWQGSVLLEVSPSSDGQPTLNIPSLIAEIHNLRTMGFKGIKLTDLYLKSAASEAWEPSSYFYANDFDALGARLGNLTYLGELARSLHAENLSLVVDIPAYSDSLTVEPELDFRITKAIQFWAGVGVDGLALLGLEQYGTDRFIAERISAWNTDYEKYSPLQQRILITSFLFPQVVEHSHQEVHGAKLVGHKALSGASVLTGLSLLEAGLNVSRSLASLNEEVTQVTQWDKVASNPWILWRSVAAETEEPGGAEQLCGAELALLIFLPGTISLPWSRVDLALNESSPSIVQQLISARQTAIPLFMNGNYKVCSGGCEESHPREDNFKITVLNGTLVVMERHYNRRNRFLLVANFGEVTAELTPVAKLFSDGEVVVDTSGATPAGSTIKFKSQSGIAADHALVIKLPK